jgi:PQQ-dependent catabolism-associated CXXCW motif protein
MVRTLVGILLLLGTIIGQPTAAQDTKGFPVGTAGQGKRCFFGECEDGAPPRTATPAPEPPRANPPVARAPAPQVPPPRLNESLNFANELTNFGVPPQNVLQQNLGTRTPTSVSGARVVTTTELRRAIQSGLTFLLVDAWDDIRHARIPGAVHIPYAGHFGHFNDNIQRQLYQELGRRTGFDPAYPIVFYCAGAECWESYNAVLRARVMGFSNIFWYRGGSTAWNEANQTAPGAFGIR